MVKISALPSDTGPTLDDYVPDVDAAGPTTKRTLWSAIRDLFFNNISTTAPLGNINYVVSGGVWTADSVGVNRNASMTAVAVRINGRYITITAVTARTFTASKDTYVDVLDNGDGTGTLVYTEVTNGAAAPALAANSLRIAKIVTGATTITAASSIVQTGVDSLNNWIYPTSAIGDNSWKSWTPTFANLTIGNAVLDCKYRQIGKTVFFRMTITLGTTSSVGSAPTFTLPVTAVDEGVTTMPIAQGNTGSKNTWLSLNSTTTGIFRVWDANNDLGTFNATNPVTFGNGTKMQFKGFYEAA